MRIMSNNQTKRETNNKIRSTSLSASRSNATSSWDLPMKSQLTPALATWPSPSPPTSKWTPESNWKQIARGQTQSVILCRKIMSRASRHFPLKSRSLSGKLASLRSKNALRPTLTRSSCPSRMQTWAARRSASTKRSSQGCRMRNSQRAVSTGPYWSIDDLAAHATVTEANAA